MIKLRLYNYDLPLKHTFRIAHNSRDAQQTLIVVLQDGDHKGYGEATATPYYGYTIEAMKEAIVSKRQLIESSTDLSPEDFWATLQPHFANLPFALCALDVAFHDLHARKMGQPLYQLWGLNSTDLPLTNYTIGIDSIENMVQKMKEMPWPLYKIKLGTTYDVDIIKSLRQHTDATFRVDANCGWTAQETITNSVELQKLGVEFIEQPLAATDWEGMAEVKKHSSLPVIADESCIGEKDVNLCAKYFDGVNIKIMKAGGLTPALRMIKNARELNLKVMIGCMTESSIGIAAVAQLLPLVDFADLDGSLLLSRDIAKGIQIDYGKITYTNNNGTGAMLIS